MSLIACVLIAIGLTTSDSDAQRRFRFVPAASTPSTLQNHPRIWLPADVQSRITAKASGMDADWEDIVDQADADVVATIAKCTPTAVSNASPGVVTCSEDVPFTDAAMVIVGATGGWAGVNTTTGSYTYGHKTGTKTFALYTCNYFGQNCSAAKDTSSYGSFSGQSLNVFLVDGESGQLGWSQYGHGYLEAIATLALAYRFTSDTDYRDKALEFIDYVNVFGAFGNNGPQWVDGGRAGSFKTVWLAVAYDWLFSSLDSTRRAATIATLNSWVTFINTQGPLNCSCAYAYNDPTSNYWMGYQTLIAAVAYATYDENASGPTWKTLADTRWSAAAAKIFGAPSTSSPAYDSGGTGQYYRGLNFLGENYGGNDISRYVKYFLMVESATGSRPTNADTYATYWARAMIHDFAPSRQRTITWGRWTGSYMGVPSLTRPLMLSYFLGSSTEGGWAQWAYENVSGTGAQVADVFDKLLYLNTSKTDIDYTASEDPYAFVDGSTAVVHWRSGWDTSAHWTYFRATAGLMAADIQKDAGHVEIWRGSDNLTMEAAFFKGTGTGRDGSPEVNSYANGFASTLYFFDGGGRICFTPNAVTNEAYWGCQMFYGLYATPKYRLTDDYGYAMANLSTAYGGNGTSAANRTLTYFVRTWVPMGDGTVIVWDRTRATNAAFDREIRWQLPGTTTPTCTAGVCTTGTVGSSKLFVESFMPTAGVPGPASMQIVRNTNQGGSSQVNYRLVVSDPEPGLVGNFLHCLEATASGDGQSACGLLSTIDANWVGVQVDASTPKVVVLPANMTDTGSSVYVSTLSTSAAFVTTHSGTAKYLVAGGLSAGSYTVRRNGSTVTTCTLSADNDPCYFTASSGTITVN